MTDNSLLKYCTLLCVIIALIAPARSLSKDISISNDKACFMKNIGQIIGHDRQPVHGIDYQLYANGVSLFVSNGMLQYQWYKKRGTDQTPVTDVHGNIADTNTITDVYTMQVMLVGANKNVLPVAGEEQAYYENYYLPYCNGKTAHSYNKITYKDIYPGIDWVLYTNGGNIKYDFIVHPGGKVSDIKLQYKNATLILEDGDLHATAGIGAITEKKPYTYDAASKKVLPSSFALKGNVMSFDVKNNDNNNTIIIDPLINWGTYYGGTYGTCTAADTFGNSYLCGYGGGSNVATSGSAQDTFGGAIFDGFICQFDINGARNWATYYGGNGNERILAVTTSAAGDVFVTGMTASGTLIGGGINPQQRAFGGILVGGSVADAFLARFTRNGSFVWGTYIGGEQHDAGRAVACDNNNSIYVGGVANSDTGIYANGYQSTKGVGFFARYNISDGRRVWGSYFNGEINALALDNRGNLFIGGLTYGYTGVATSGTHQPLYLAGSMKGYVTRFKALTGVRSWGTYYGGEREDEVHSLVCDSFGSVYAGGITKSDTGIYTTGSLQSARIGITIFANPPDPIPYSGMVFKLDSSGKRVWGTYYPGVVNSMALGPDHKVYIGGVTFNSLNVVTPGAHKVTSGGTQAFIGILTTKGKRLWGSYFGGSEEIGIISYGGTPGGVKYGGNKIFIGGLTSSRTGIGTSNGFQPTFVAYGYHAQFYADTSVYIKFPYIDSLLCAGDSLKINYGVTNFFRPNNVFTAQLSDPTGNFATAVNIGSIADSSRGEIRCLLPAIITESANYSIRIIASAPADTFYNYDVPVRMSYYPKPTATITGSICANLSLTMLDSTVQPPDTKYSWLSPNPARTPGTSNPNIVTNITLADSGDYILIADNHSCIRRDTVHVHVTTAPPEPTITGDTSLCIGDTLKLVASSSVSGVDYFWFDPASQLLSQQANIQVPAVTFADAGKYRVAAILNGCQSDPLYGQIVTVHPLPQPSANSNTPVCEGDTLRLTSTDTTNVSYAWSGPQGFMAARKDTIIANASAAADGTYAVKTTTIHGCVSTASTPVVIKPSPKIEALSNSPICEHDAMSLSVGNGAGNASYSWMGPGNYTANTQAATRPDAVLNQSGIYKVTATLNGCIREDTTVVVISEAPEKPQAGSNSPLFTGEVLKLSIGNAQNNISYNWTGPNGFISQLTNPVINKAIPAMSGVYTVIAQVGTCTAYDTIIVVVRDASGNNNKNDLLVFPNPNNGVFRVKGTTKENNIISLAVFASDGKRIYEASIQPVNNIIDETINIGTVANGVYRLKIWIDGKMIPVSFTVKQ